jgi:hypothetical protein
MRAVLRWLAWPFYSADERRPRALVRIFVQLAVLAMVSPVFQYAVSETWEAARGTAAQPGSGRPEAYLGLGALDMVYAGVVLWSVWLAAKHLDRRPVDDLGLRASRAFWLDLAFGTVLGGLLMAAILGVEVALGWASYEPAPPIRGGGSRWAYVPVTLLTFVSVAVREELVFRGYQLTNLAEGLTGRWISPSAATLLAVAVSSLGFGLAHAANPHADLLSTGNIAIAGVMLAAGYVTTGELAIPIGLHLGWNLFQNLFGMPVSGQTRFHFGRLLERQVDGPAWLTGGSFGPEAGLTGLLAMAAGTLAILGWVRMRYGPLHVHPALTARRFRLRARGTDARARSR